MTNAEAIETLRANYPDACFSLLREAVDAAIEALKARDAAGDTISRQAAIAYSISGMTREIDGEKWIRVSEVRESIKTMPSAQPERKTGKWIKNEDRHSWHCSECMEDNFYAYSWNSETGREEFQDHYCPNCGVKMREESDNG